MTKRDEMIHVSALAISEAGGATDWDHAVACATAAIDAALGVLMEPSEEMIIAGSLAVKVQGEHRAHKAVSTWAAMLSKVGGV